MNPEPLLTEPSRFTVFPIIHHDIWAMYKKQQAAFWKAEEIDFSKDGDDYLELSELEQEFVKHVLAFFAASDGIVNFNLKERFMKEMNIMEIQIVYGWQFMMENIHGEVYSQMLNNIIKDKTERTHLFNAIQNVPSIKKMSDWAFKWIESSDSLGYRLLAFAIVEGVFFSSAFAAIFWLKKHKGEGRHFLNGLTESNKFISRDEGLHTEFACMLYDKLVNRLPETKVFEIMDEAVNISMDFSNDAITTKLVGMNSDLMNQYIKYVADRLLKMLHYNKLYNATNPFDFMDTIGMQQKTNFFEHRPTEYQSANTENNLREETIEVLEDF